MKYLLLICLALIGFNVFVWNSVLSAAVAADGLNEYFLDVGQGDSELVKLPGPNGQTVKILIDAGNPKSVLRPLEAVMAPTDRYIDILLCSHPQLDHFGGYLDVLDHFKVGIFIWNGRDDGKVTAWQALMKKLKVKNVRTLVLKEGDSITYHNSKINFLGPNASLVQSKELNDTVLVAKLTSEGSKTLFTGDIGFKSKLKNLDPEDYLADYYDISADILKVAHHGSKTSSSDKFLEAVNPKLSVIEVGVRNTYGHPTKEAMGRIADIGSSLYRTDQNGTVHIRVKNGIIEVFKSK